MAEDTRDTLMRIGAFNRVQDLQRAHPFLTKNEYRTGFEFEGKRIPLVNPQRGIFKPKQMRFLLSIRTVFPRPGGKVWNDDQREVHRQTRYTGATIQLTTPSWARIPMRPTIAGSARPSRTAFP